MRRALDGMHRRYYNHAMSIETALEALRQEPRFMRNVVHWAHLPPRAAQRAAFPAGLDDRLKSALGAPHFSGLYTHQSLSVAAALRGEHVAVVTPAASGKTLCYELPVLHRLLADPSARALLLFPTKALAQDQLAALTDLIQALDQPIPCAVYDGDTPSSQRARVREAARIVLSNPDMLQAGVLPQHTRWATFFSNLRVVVIDEMHVYRGVFGSHVANVLRRLRRICHFYGSNPQFILASATIANPGDLAERLVEAPVIVIGPDDNGAPQGSKAILVYNPPMLDPVLGIRRSSNQEAADLATHFLSHDVQTIVFARARLTTELMLSYLRDAARRGEPAGAGLPISRSGRQSPEAAIRGYRSGYLPVQRRDIERGLREGTVRCVVTTTALELGIDIGQLDAAVLAGYPGTVAGAWQQMGRAGRRQATAAAVLVVGPGAMDQYIAAHPEYLLEGSVERALINPDNQVILAEHLACAAAELPLQAGEALALVPGAADLIADLQEAAQLYRADDRFYWAGSGYPASAVSLRNASPDRVVIQTREPDGSSAVIGEIDRAAVSLLLYENAVYLHDGASYLVERLDWEGGVATVRAEEVDFYTRPAIGERIDVLREHQTVRSVCQTSWGDVRVVSQATGYRVLRRTTHQVLGFGAISLPEQVLETQACWLAFSPELVERLRAVGDWLSDPNEYGPEWPAQRDAARARDGRRCQACGVLEAPGRQHDVHHKIPFRAFLADPGLRAGLAPEEARLAANRLENLVTLCPACHTRAEASVRTRSGLGGLAALMTGIAPLHLMCDPHDLGAVVEPKAPRTGLPTITIYERVPFGVGYAQALYASMPNLLRAANDLVSRCPCTHGCPACVGPILDHEYALDTKGLTTSLLQSLLADEGSAHLENSEDLDG
jgi:DEAD/DEAH box helicase domain-containing protein